MTEDAKTKAWEEHLESGGHYAVDPHNGERFNISGRKCCWDAAMKEGITIGIGRGLRMAKIERLRGK